MVIGWGAVVSFFKHMLDKCVPPNGRDCAIVEGEPEEICQGWCQFLCNCARKQQGMMSGRIALIRP